LSAEGVLVGLGVGEGEAVGEGDTEVAGMGELVGEALGFAPILSITP
jgi:hypothetical protein